MYRKKGQSILEYVIVLTAIVAVIIAGAALFVSKGTDTDGATSEKGLGKLMTDAGKTITSATGKFVNVGIGKTGPP